MTQLQTIPIKCECGSLVDFNLYQSVNVTVSPSLSSKVKKRKINNFKCNRCGAKSELAHNFLYVDMEKGIWIWCYPEAERKNKNKIEKELIKTQALTNVVQKLGQSKPKIVFGYDELLDGLDSKGL